MERRRRIAWAWMLSILWMTMIFVISAMTGEASGAQSSRLTQMLLGALSSVFGAIDEKNLEMIVRKGAHMAEYAVLFVLYLRALRLNGAKGEELLSLLMTVAYAATDEFHQMFVPGRAGMASDVAIDACGALIAWAVISLTERIKVRFR